MSNSSAHPSHWERCYQMGDTRWDKGAPAPGLVDFLAAHPKLPHGTVLVPGCGTGHDVRAWAQAGFHVTGLDIAPSGVRLARERTMAASLRARFRCGDFLHHKPRVRFDWLFEHTLFCAINSADRDAYAQAVARCVKSGGCFLAVHYMIPTGGDAPPFGVTRRELWERFSPHFKLVSEWTPRSYPNRVGLEQMLWWRRKETGEIRRRRTWKQELNSEDAKTPSWARRRSAYNHQPGGGMCGG